MWMWMCGAACGCDTVQLWHIFSGVRDRYEANRSYYRQLLEHNESKETPFAAEIEQVTCGLDVWVHRGALSAAVY